MYSLLQYNTLTRDLLITLQYFLLLNFRLLIFYRKFVSSYSSALKPNGFFAFEIGFDQGESVKSLGIAAGLEVEIIRDYSGNDRVAILKKNY